MITKLTLEYDGGGFAGWGLQPGLRTVQGELERVLCAILGERGTDGRRLRLTVAGRTDAGVHAWGQVASYAHEAVDPQRLNALLAEDVAVLGAEPAAAGFDARRDARSRTYCYRVLARRARGALERGRSLWWAGRLDLDALRGCAAVLAGRHDFSAFTPAESEHRHFVCDVKRALWRALPCPAATAQGWPPAPPWRLSDTGACVPAGGAAAALGDRSPALDPAAGALLEFWIEADVFLRHMVRTLVGTMLDVATGTVGAERFEALLGGAPRSEAGKTAAPHGLALASVAYEPAPMLEGA